LNQLIVHNVSQADKRTIEGLVIDAQTPCEVYAVIIYFIFIISTLVVLLQVLPFGIPQLHLPTGGFVLLLPQCQVAPPLTSSVEGQDAKFALFALRYCPLQWKWIMIQKKQIRVHFSVWYVCTNVDIVGGTPLSAI